MSTSSISLDAHRTSDSHHTSDGHSTSDSHSPSGALGTPEGPEGSTRSEHRTRVADVLAGRLPDRVPVTAWQHHIPEESDVVRLADRVAAETRRHDWDWVKINPRATYLPEAFGNTYDLTRYRGVQPWRTRTLVTSPADLDLVQPTTTAPSLLEHVRLVELLREHLPDLPLLPTVFSPLSVLLELTGTPTYAGAVAPGAPTPRDLLTAWYAERPTAVHSALVAIAETLVHYLRATTAAGADGVFYAVTGTANPAITSPELFAELSTPYDDLVLNSVTGWRVVHTCGDHADPERFDRPGVHAVHWDQTAPGNPALGEVRLRAAAVGGFSHEAAGAGEIAVVGNQVRAALELGQPFLLAPSCSVPPSVPERVYEEVSVAAHLGIGASTRGNARV